MITPNEIAIGGRKLTLSNLDKVFYPKTGFTKGEVIDYYARIGPVLLPHLKDRPLTLKRYPNGVEGEYFYEKRCPAFRPRWLKTAPIWSDRQNGNINFCLANDLASLVWAANLADLELHTFLARYRKPNEPTAMVFDLDPGAGADILDCGEVGLWLHTLFSKMKLECFAKTSGSKGLQVYVPLNTRVTFEQTKEFSHKVAEEIARAHPGKVVSLMKKSLRAKKVFIDWSQNDDHKTTVCVYSLRAKEHPTVSTPVKWDEVKKAVKAGNAKSLSFESSAVLKRVEKFGDLFEPVLTLKQKLPRLS